MFACIYTFEDFRCSLWVVFTRKVCPVETAQDIITHLHRQYCVQYSIAQYSIKRTYCRSDVFKVDTMNIHEHPPHPRPPPHHHHQPPCSMFSHNSLGDVASNCNVAMASVSCILFYNLQFLHTNESCVIQYFNDLYGLLVFSTIALTCLFPSCSACLPPPHP